MKPTIRTTLGEYLSRSEDSISGIYVIACYPAFGVLYIGISNNVEKRIREHLNGDSELAKFLRSIFADACGFRLDIFEINDKEDRIYYEKRMIEYFNPIYNTQHK